MTTFKVKVNSSKRFGACTFSFTEGRLSMVDLPLYTVTVRGYKLQVLIWQRDDGVWYYEVDTTQLPSRCYDGHENFDRWLNTTGHVYCVGGFKSAKAAWQALAWKHL